MSRFYPGAVVPLQTTVTNNGALVDPDAISLVWKLGPWGSETALTPTRLSAGRYAASVQLPPDTGDNYGVRTTLFYRWQTAGQFVTVSDGAINIANTYQT